MKKFMGLLLVMTLLMGAASMGIACGGGSGGGGSGSGGGGCGDTCPGDATCKSASFTAHWKVVENLWIKVQKPGKLIYDPCDHSKAKKDFAWGYGANGCATFYLDVKMDTVEYTKTSPCLDPVCHDRDYFPDFKLTMNKTSHIFDGKKKTAQHICFGELKKPGGCKDSCILSKNGSLKIIADNNTCTGEGSTQFTFTIYAKCLK